MGEANHANAPYADENMWGPEVTTDLHFSISKMGICSKLLLNFSQALNFDLSPELGVNRHSTERHANVSYNKFLCTWGKILLSFMYS